MQYTKLCNMKSKVFFVFSLMRDAEKLMSRCIYLNILKATIVAAKENQTSSETLEKYVMNLSKVVVVVLVCS